MQDTKTKNELRGDGHKQAEVPCIASAGRKSGAPNFKEAK